MRFELSRPFLFQIFDSRGGSVLVFKKTKDEAITSFRNYFWGGLTDEEKMTNEELEENYLIGQQHFFCETILVRHLVNGKDLGNCGGGVQFVRPIIPEGPHQSNILIAIPRNLDVPEGMVEVRMDDDAFVCLILR